MGPEASLCVTLIRFTVNLTLFLCNVSTAFNDLAKVSPMKTGVRYKQVLPKMCVTSSMYPVNPDPLASS